MTTCARKSTVEDQLSAKVIKHRDTRSFRLKSPGFDGVLVDHHVDMRDAGNDLRQLRSVPLRGRTRRFYQDHRTMEHSRMPSEQAIQFSETCPRAGTMRMYKDEKSTRQRVVH